MQRMIDLLLQHGADPQAADAEQRTALFYAARANRAATSWRCSAPVRCSMHAIGAATTRSMRRSSSAPTRPRRSCARLGLHANRVTVDPARHSGKFDPARPGDIYRGWPALALAVARNDSAGRAAAAGCGRRCQSAAAAGRSVAAGRRRCARRAEFAAAADARRRCGARRPCRPHHALARRDPQRPRRGQGAARCRRAADTHAAAEQTPLLAALRAKHPDVAQMLLAAGANAEATDAQGRTPLMLACAGGRGLRSSRCCSSVTFESTPRITTAALRCWYAAAAGSRDEVTLLLADGAKPKVGRRAGVTALHAAAAQADADVLAPLLAVRPASIGVTTGGDTPLLIAAASGPRRGRAGAARPLAGTECSEHMPATRR